MYTRSYDNESRINIPENYDGNAFVEAKSIKESSSNKESELTAEALPLRAPWDISREAADGDSAEVMAKPKINDGFWGELMSKLPFGSILGKGNFLKSTFSDFGTEELLILGVALFLLLSKDGDKECALILLFLIFVK